MTGQIPDTGGSKMKKLTTKEDVHALLHSSAALAAMSAAIETGLLWALAERPLDGDGVADLLGIPPRRCYYWLQFLQSLGILDETSRGYVPSALTRSSILETRSRESWKHLVLDERERIAGTHDLASYIREPGSIWEAQGLTQPRNYVEKMKASASRAREFTRMLYEIHQYLGNELAALLDMTGVHRMMDAGGGSGVVSMALLRKYPGLTAMVVDIENVCIAGGEIAQENSLSDRITFHAADLQNDEFPGGFDLVLLCDVYVRGEVVYRRLWNSLNPGGRLVLVDHYSPAEYTPPEKLLEWTFLDSLEDPDIYIPTITQTQDELVRAGYHLLPGEHTLSDQRIVLQARK
jgi:3-hydroxy-5-methyl-1-naphthoate 3-O-methyltransferase